MRDSSRNTDSNSSLWRKIWFTICMIILYRFGSYIPIPGIDAVVMNQFMQQNQSGIMGMFNMLSGGSLGRMSIFALAIMPYITSSIIIQLLSMSYKTLAEMKKNGEQGRKKINQISRYLTILISVIQGLGITSALEMTQLPIGKLVMIPGPLFKFVGVISLVVGTMLLMWLGEQITAKGIGNGSSIIIFIGIISQVPGNIISSLELIRKGGLPVASYAATIIFSLLMIAIVIFCEKAIRKIKIHHPKHHNESVTNQENSFLPIKINIAGVIPPMFADAMLRFPLTIANFSNNPDSMLSNIGTWLSHGKPIFMVLYTMLIVFFCFTYTAIVFNTEEIATNVKKSNVVVNSIRPGEKTREYLDFVVTRVTCIGSAYIATICLIPEILSYNFNISIVGGTTVMIVVNVVIDTFTQIQSYSMPTRYDRIAKRLRAS